MYRKYTAETWLQTEAQRPTAIGVEGTADVDLGDAEEAAHLVRKFRHQAEVLPAILRLESIASATGLRTTF